MHVIRIERITMAEAEELIAALWLKLEECQLGSPRLQVSRAGETVDLRLELGLDGDDDLARRAPRLWEVPSPMTAWRTAVGSGDKVASVHSGSAGLDAIARWLGVGLSRAAAEVRG
ncbi:MAG TPA: hypothetical protein VMA53_06115 [Stellaceae bacterium]|nr:hypothetical protein [Stellaceae bacterium]